MGTDTGSSAYRKLRECPDISNDDSSPQAMSSADVEQWRFVRGSRAGELYVKMPLSDLCGETGSARDGRSGQSQTIGTSSETNRSDAVEHRQKRGDDASPLLAQMVETIGNVVTQQRGEIAALVRARSAEAAARSAAEAQNRLMKDELERQRAEVARLGEAHTKLSEGHTNTLALLVATEGREMTLEGEVIRLTAEVDRLHKALAWARKPWWRRLGGQ